LKLHTLSQVSTTTAATAPTPPALHITSDIAEFERLLAILQSSAANLDQDGGDSIFAVITNYINVNKGQDKLNQ
jgi:hypothetical protein